MVPEPIAWIPDDRTTMNGSSMSEKMRLLAFMMHTPINHMTMSWADPADQQAAGLGSIEHWQDLARLFESGLFDGVFFADVPAVYGH